MIKNNDRLMHRTAAFIGGYTALFTIMEHSNLGSAQTLNMLDIIRDIFGHDFLEAALRVLGVIIYASSIFGVTVLGKKTKCNLKLLSAFVNIGGFILLALIPENVDPLLSIYPAFIMMSIEWVVFGSLCGYASSPIFSTNNLRQTFSALAEYFCDHDKTHLDKAKFFGGTLIMFHLGALAGYFMCEKFSLNAALFGIIPSVFIIFLELVPKFSESSHKSKIKCNYPDTAKCNNTTL